ncbi:MAG: homoserine kinase [Candidatus Marinimicrobia bacterium]|nr:homoserine kinase [Candidatus Neomarinimicrobiota bacterium]
MKKVKVFAPATVANVSCGYDVLGFAIEYPGDEVVAKLIDEPKVIINKITGDGGKLPLEAEKNTAGVSVINFLKHINSKQGIELEIHKKMALGSGLGSSASSSVASVFAVNSLLGNPLSKRELLPFTMDAEKIACGFSHADNVAPSLLGGLILIRSYNPLDVIKIRTPKLFATVIHPEVIVKTEDARNILDSKVPLNKVVEQCGNLAGLIVGMFTSDYELISRSLEDKIIEPQRAKLIPNFYEVKKVAMENGALGCGISGSGPSIFALSKDKNIAENVGEKMKNIYEIQNIKSEVFVSQISDEGVKEI